MMEWICVTRYQNGSSVFEHSEGALIRCPHCRGRFWVGWYDVFNPKCWFCSKDIPGRNGKT